MPNDNLVTEIMCRLTEVARRVGIRACGRAHGVTAPCR
jgi:hypothetical protein